MNNSSLAQQQIQASQTPAPLNSNILQCKTCACGRPITAYSECTECRKKRLALQRRAVNQGGPDIAPPVVHEVLRSAGRPLDATTRAFMEPRFGYDFSQVRVHTDAKAAESARAVNALAYTVGRDVVFSTGQYAPGTMSGRRLLGHELTHVMQQRQGDRHLLQLKRADRSACPKGFDKIEQATWFHCGEKGARNLACATCTPERRRDPNCANLVGTLGHSNIIAPPQVGRCGDIFEITTPRRTEPPINVTLAERPGGTPLDIHIDVIPQLGLTVEGGRYTVCLRPTGHRDERVITAGPARCTPVAARSE